MLRLPDPEVTPDTTSGAPNVTLRAVAPRQRRQGSNGTRRRTPIAFSVADAVEEIVAAGPAEPARSPEAEVPAPTPGPAPRVAPPGTKGNGHKARNPLFQAIEGGAAGEASPAKSRRSPAGTIGERQRATRRRPQLSPGGAERIETEEDPRLAPSDDADGSVRPECYACPVGVAFSTVRGSSPETLEHLMAATKELVAAARSVIGTFEANLDRRTGGRTKAARIPLD